MMRSRRSSIGLVLAALSGAVFGSAIPAHDPTLWWVAGVGFVLGVVLVLSSLRGPGDERARKPAAEPPPQAWVEWRETGVPRLGTLLMDRYGLITHGELMRALAIQRGSPRRLGEVLISMGIITESDLETALKYQQDLQRQSWPENDRAAVQDGRLGRPA